MTSRIPQGIQMSDDPNETITWGTLGSISTGFTKLNDIRKPLVRHIFRREGDNSLIVFLCGKGITQKDSIRNLLKVEMEKNKRIQIAYPELLFSDSTFLKEDDMLALEKRLADWVDVIVIPLESNSTFVELGAFCALTELINKVVVFNNQDYAKEASFINLGPIAAVRRANKENVALFKLATIELDSQQLAKEIAKKHKKADANNLNNIFNIARLIKIIIAIFQPISLVDISKTLKEFNVEKADKYIRSCISHLIAQKMIEGTTYMSKSCYKLTENGFKSYIESVERTSGLSKHVESRAITMRNVYKRCRKEFRGGGVNRILETGKAER